MENFDAKAQSFESPVGWISRIAQDQQTLTAWAYALGCGKAQVAQGMLRLLGVFGRPTGSGRSLHLPASFEDHVETELRHAESLHQAALREEAFDQRMGQAMAQAVECYVRGLLGYAERQTLCQEAQYCTATLALGSRIFRHSSELSRKCGELEFSQVLTRIVEEEARHVRTAQALLQSLPRETHGIYRSVRAFEEMLFGRMIRKLSQGLDLTERSASKRPANPPWLARCV